MRSYFLGLGSSNKDLLALAFEQRMGFCFGDFLKALRATGPGQTEGFSIWRPDPVLQTSCLQTFTRDTEGPPTTARVRTSAIHGSECGQSKAPKIKNRYRGQPYISRHFAGTRGLDQCSYTCMAALCFTLWVLSCFTWFQQDYRKLGLNAVVGAELTLPLWVLHDCDPEEDEEFLRRRRK